MGRRPGGRGTLPARRGQGRHRDRQHDLPGGAHPQDPALAGGAAGRLRLPGGLPVGRRDRAHDKDRRVLHVRQAGRSAGAAEAAARRRQEGRLGRAPADEAAAPDPAHPALHPRQGAGRALLFPDPAIHAGGVGREHLQHGAPPDRPLCRRTAGASAPRHLGQGADRVSGSRALPSRARRTGVGDRGGPAWQERRGRHGRAPDHALLRAGREHRPL